MASGLIDAVCAQYLTSRDFNGYPLTNAEAAELTAAIDGVNAGLLQVVSEEDFPNPHVRPWPSRRSTESQVESLSGPGEGPAGLCLYPTPAALAARVANMYPHEPYRQAMAEGRGSLELAYFEVAALEAYVNDPRFTFTFSDFGARMVVSDATYEDEREPDHDNVVMGHVGFAYDLSDYEPDDPTSPIRRRICAFYGDLAKLTPRHQQRWRTHEVSGETSLNAHPVWMMGQMGHWADGIGPFDLFFGQLSALNDLSERAFGEPLLRTTDRPPDFGWLLRPTQRDWDRFVSELDKLLSENLRASALDVAGAPESDEHGQKLGTLGRLQRLIVAWGADGETASEVMSPLREVRKARQQPAHALRANVSDQTFVHKQVVLLEDVNESLRTVCGWLRTHPTNRHWQEPDELRKDALIYRM